MSLIVVYHDTSKAVIASDDRMCREDPVTLEKTVIDGRVSKIIVLPLNIVFGTVGRVDLTEKLFCGLTRMCGENAFDFERIANVLPGLLRLTWKHRKPMQLSAEINKQDCLLLGNCSGAIKCYAFRSEDDFQPIETTSPGNRVIALGGFDLVDKERLQRFTMDTGVRGKQMRAPWIAGRIRDLINEISALHSVSIGQASYFTAINRDGSIALPPEFPPPPTAYETELAQRAALAEADTALHNGGYMYVGSIITPPPGGQDTAGYNDGGGGAQIGNLNILSMSVSKTATFAVPASFTNAQKAVDGDTSTFAVISASGGGGGGGSLTAFFGGPAGITRNYHSALLKAYISIPTNTLNNGPYLSFSGSYSIDGGNSFVPFATGIAGIAGTTYPITLGEAVLPVGLNLSQVILTLTVNASGSTSGVVDVNVYEVWIEAVE